jgi:trk system potassium uptake protein TrkA
LKRQVVVIGLGRFGSAVAATLSRMGNDVLGIDSDMESVQRLASQLAQAVQADATEQETLESLGLRDFDTGVVGIGENLEASILATLNLRRLGVRHIISKARTEQHGEILLRVGADRVVFPEWDTGVRLAESGLLDAITASFDVVEGFSVARVVVPSSMDGRTLLECGLAGDKLVTALLRASGQDVEMGPAEDQRLQTGDVLVVAGLQADVLRAFR